MRSRVETFRQSLSDAAPPPEADLALQALWWAGKDDWDRAHERAQAGEGADCALVHAYLHRVEGDLANAAYWYRRAGTEPARGAPEREWVAIAERLLARGVASA